MDTLSSMFGGKRKFKGQGHKLGSGETSKSAPKQPPVSSTNPGSHRQPPVSRSLEALQTSHNSPRPTQQATSSSTSPRLTQSRTASAAEQPSTLEYVAPASATSRPEEGAHQQGQAKADLSEARPSLPQRPAAPEQLSLMIGDGAGEDATEEVQQAIGLLHSDQQGAEAAATLIKLLSNISLQPGEAKFRRIRLSNARIQKAVVDVSGGLELLQACGFDIIFEDDAEGGDGDGFAVLPEEHDLNQLRAALALLRPLASAQQGSTPSSTAVAPLPTAPPAPRAQPEAQLAEPCDRKTQVLLPAETEGRTLIPDWVYKRTPAEVKEQLLAARKKREQSEVLMTRAMREKLNVKERPRYTQATVRVRLPEGLLLQGQFNAGEPVVNILNWMTDCLADPGTTYELVLPNRMALVTSMGTVRSADLLPSVLLHFRRDGQDRGQTLTLRPEIMALATPNTGA